MLSLFLNKIKKNQQSIQLWSCAAAINLLFFYRKNIFNITKKKIVLKTFIKILIGIGEMPLIDIF